MQKTSDEKVCRICMQEFEPDELTPAWSIRKDIADEIHKEHPEWKPEGFICISDLDHYRELYIKHAIEEEKGELTSLEQEVVKAITSQELLSANMDKEFDSNLTIGQRLADKVAEFGGSWNFIIIFLSIMFLWILLNTITLLTRHFDPYPYILLNLVLSCIASIQAPVIMMSQNRQETKDRMRGEHDYQVNLKAEMEIRTLTQKMDHLLHIQWERLLEIQEIQTEMIRELVKKSENHNGVHPANNKEE